MDQDITNQTGDTTQSTTTQTVGAAQMTDTTAQGADITQSNSETVYDEEYVQSLKKSHESAMQKAVDEAVKKASMSADEATEYAKKEAEIKLAEKEKELIKRELKADARTMLAEKEIPIDFLDMVIGADAKETSSNIANFKKQFDHAVQAQVEKRLVGVTPKTSSGMLPSDGCMAAEVDKYMV